MHLTFFLLHLLTYSYSLLCFTNPVLYLSYDLLLCGTLISLSPFRYFSLPLRRNLTNVFPVSRVQ